MKGKKHDVLLDKKRDDYINMIQEDQQAFVHRRVSKQMDGLNAKKPKA
jgi:hypothetical protein